MHTYAFALGVHALLCSQVAGSSLGAYIRAGLGITTTTTITVTEISTSATFPVKTPFVNSTATNDTLGALGTNDTVNAGSLLRWQSCAESWDSWSSSIDTLKDTYIPSLLTTYFALTTDITHGTANVYTSKDGIPIASGNFTPTKVVHTVLNVTSCSETFHLNHAATISPPSCSSISPFHCSLLYDAYLDDLGLSGDPTIPIITPAPANSPRCPANHHKQSWSACNYQTPLITCSLEGSNVQLFYFPPQTSNGSAPIINATVVQSYAPGITFTSPSLYMSLDYLSGTMEALPEPTHCTSCWRIGTSVSCTEYDTGGASDINADLIGTIISGVILSVHPSDASSFILSYPDELASAYANAVARGTILEDYFYNAWNMKTQHLDLNALIHPALTDYYLNPRGVPGCNVSYPTPECSTVFEGAYWPQISLPAQASLLQEAWNTCTPGMWGVWDPPYALTEASTLDGPSYYAATISTSTNSPGTSPHQAVPASSLSAVIPTETANLGVSAPAQYSPIVSSSSWSNAEMASPTAFSESSPTRSGSATPAAETSLGRSEPPYSSASGGLAGAYYDTMDDTVSASGHVASTVPTEAVPPPHMNALSVLLSAVEYAYPSSDAGVTAQQQHTNAGESSFGSTTFGTDAELGSPAVQSIVVTPSAAFTTTICIDEQAFTINTFEDGIVLNGVDIPSGPLGMVATDALLTTMNGQRVSVGSGVIIIADKTVSIPSIFGPLRLGMAQTVVSGAIVSVNSQTLTIAIDPTASSIAVVDGSITITIGDSAQMVSGLTVSAGEGGVLIDGSYVHATAICTVDPSQDVASEDLISILIGSPTQRLSGLTMSATDRNVLLDGTFMSAVSTLSHPSEPARTAATTPYDAISSARMTNFATSALTTSSAVHCRPLYAFAVSLLLCILGLAAAS
ncbi:hypothetical protein LTR10_006492 [Elasticomyces elasticus]|nr:hypothetical protein LTR10_006492 [Elasticomyces elasticus]KAK4973110.1 hypothetical protein LTR42_006404 [Elasticomyces elasticus]